MKRKPKSDISAARGGSSTTSQRHYVQEGLGYVKTTIIVFPETVKR
jgi:hypothetical protein